MNTLRKKFGNKSYREAFVGAQLKSGIPFQIRQLMHQRGISQAELAERAGLTQGVVSRAASSNYGNLTLNTIIRLAAGFDVAFVGQFVPFSELERWFEKLPGRTVKTFSEEHNEGRQEEL